MSLKGKTYFITGGASGLGEACVRLLLQHGANVVIGDVNEEDGNKMTEELTNDHTLFVKTDVSSEDSVKEAISQGKAKFGQIHGAINCAGVGSAMKIASSRGAHSLDLFKKVIDINLTGTFNVCRLIAQDMINQQPDEHGERGVLINVASVAAFEGQIGQIAYSASKGGIVAMTLGIARDLGKSGIRCCTIAPGVFDTPMLRYATDEVRMNLKKDVQFPPRLGKSEEFAQLALCIIQNRYLNGETIRLDGALRMAAL